MPLTSQTEIERKYDADDSVVVPDLSTVPGVSRVTPPEIVQLRAVYFDTDDLALARNRIALRRREGGADEGWHLKLPADLGRTEIHTALTTADRIPAELRAAVEVFLRGRPVTPLALIETRRTIRELLDAQGEPIVEVADDVVTGSDLRHGAIRTWREVEAELAARHASEPGGTAILEDVEARLLAAGARPSASGSKLAHALGADRLGEESFGLTGAHATDGDARTPLRALLQVLETLDPRVRRDEPDSCHDMRTTVRRLRSVLAAVGPEDADTAGSLRDELRRFGALLGEARDLEVRREVAERLKRETGIDAGQTLAASFAREYSAAHGVIVDYQNSSAYFELLDALEAATGAHEPSSTELTRALRAAARNVSRWSSRVSFGDPQRPPRLADLHRVRKGARAVRYLAEALQGHATGSGPTDDSLTAMASASRRTQDILGDHRDLILFADSARLAADREDEPAGRSRSAAESYRELAARAAETASARLAAVPAALAALDGAIEEWRPRLPDSTRLG
jgi:CHAD domain-containing protein